jgi:hypothetical protein
MIRTGAISGRVLDSDGEPLTGANVEIIPISRKKDSILSFHAATDDRGQYRAYNIPPGKYHVAASYESPFQQRQVRMQRPASQSNNLHQDTWALTYYPAALDAKQAQTVTIEAEAELQGLDVQMRSARGVTVRGIAGATGGAPAGALVFVTLTPVRRTIGLPTYDNVIQDSSGGFEFGQVLAGRYVLAATAPLGDKKLSSHQLVDVGTADIDGIQLTLSSPQIISGVIVLPEARKMPASLVAVLTPREIRYDGGGGLTEPGSNGEFQIHDVAPGDYDVVLASTGAGDDLYVSSIQAGDDDALSGGIHVGMSPVGRIKVVLKANGGAVHAVVRTAEGKPLPDSQVRIVPDDPRRDQMALYGECKTDANGACDLLGVAPGSYQVFAFAEERQIDFRDPAAISDIEGLGKAINVAEGGRQNVELTVVPENN